MLIGHDRLIVLNTRHNIVHLVEDITWLFTSSTSCFAPGILQIRCHHTTYGPHFFWCVSWTVLVLPTSVQLLPCLFVSSNQNTMWLHQLDVPWRGLWVCSDHFSFCFCCLKCDIGIGHVHCWPIQVPQWSHQSWHIKEWRSLHLGMQHKKLPFFVCVRDCVCYKCECVCFLLSHYSWTIF